MSNIYGRDLSCLPNADGILDLTSDMQECTGNDVLIQSLVRRHLTAKGSDVASPNDGIDVRTLIKNGLTQTQISQLAAQVQQEIILDQRVTPASTVSATFDTATNVITFTEVIVPVQGGPFTLTIAIGLVTVSLLVTG